MYRGRHGKIVATLGPSSSTPEMIRKLHDTGVDVFRLNFSHGVHADHAARVRDIREIERQTGQPIGIMADMQGPKLRVGTFADEKVELAAGQQFRLDLDPTPGTAERVNLPHKEIFAALENDADLLVDDGKIRLRVIDHGPDFALTELIAGGPVSNRKGVNVPGVVLPLSPLTEKDRRDMQFALDQGVEWIALSFVQRPEDLAEARRLIAGRAAILTKFEKPAAIERLRELVEMSDACMVARGDLGVEMPPEEVPVQQKRLVRMCRELGKPVIVATQMLESMIKSPTPTRAEAQDVATAVYDGADAVMLSAETAAGDYPEEAVAIMDRIVRRVEADPAYKQVMEAQHERPDATAADAITAAARQVAETINAAAIVTYTTSGSTASRASRERPLSPILGLTANQRTARRLVLAWGVHSVLTEELDSFTKMVDNACQAALDHGMAKEGQALVVTAGVPFGTPGATNILRLAWVPRARLR
ncbi:MAG: pyruvate kinase [Alphaproteobacteria bacterium]